MTDQLSNAVILKHLQELIKLQHARIGSGSGKPADDTGDWLAINFLFRIGREFPRLSGSARDQLEVIFHAWTSPEELTLREFTAMLETLGGLIATECIDSRAA